MELVSYYLEKGNDLILSDTDALWFRINMYKSIVYHLRRKNPFPDLNFHSIGADIIAVMLIIIIIGIIIVLLL